MTDTLALMIGYIMGWFSVVAAHRMLRPKPIEPESKPEPEPEPMQRTPEQMEEERRWQEWLNQMDDMMKYDAKGGVKDGDKD